MALEFALRCQERAIELVAIDESTEDTFLRCLHEEIPANPEVMRMRRDWLAANVPRGHRARVLKDDSGQVVGLTNYTPIENSPYVGEGLMAILCMWIHGYEHLVGNQQSRGYGRFMLAEIERDARDSGSLGLCVWGKDFEYWNPISFYEHMGFKRVEKRGMDVLAWKPFTDSAQPPLFLPDIEARETPLNDGRIRVRNVSPGWCGGGCEQCVVVQEVLTGFGDEVELDQTIAQDWETLLAAGESLDVVYIDGEPFRPDGPPFSAKDLRYAVRKKLDHQRR